MTASVALVTGGGTGIGAAVVRRLVADGWRVALCGRRPEPIEAVARDTGALAVAADVGTEEGVERVLAATLEAHGRLDGLVLNAGAVRPGTVAELSVEDWNETLRVNLTGPFLLARASLDLLRASGGAVVTVGSVAGVRAGPSYAAYCASKAGLHMLTQAFAVDHAREGVRANCVAPGWTRTEMGDWEMGEFAQQRRLSVEDAYALVTAAVPARRPAAAEEVAAAVAWLLSPDASYINGAIVAVDGGTAAVDAGAIAFLADQP